MSEHANILHDISEQAATKSAVAISAALDLADILGVSPTVAGIAIAGDVIEVPLRMLSDALAHHETLTIADRPEDFIPSDPDAILFAALWCATVLRVRDANEETNVERVLYDTQADFLLLRGRKFKTFAGVTDCPCPNCVAERAKREDACVVRSVS